MYDGKTLKGSVLAWNWKLMGLSVGYVFKSVLQFCDDCVRRMKTHSVHFVIQSCKFFDILWVSVRSQTISAFRRHLGLIDTLGLDLMRLPRLSSVWMPREVQPFDQTTYDVGRPSYTTDFITQRKKYPFLSFIKRSLLIRPWLYLEWSLCRVCMIWQECFY